MNIPFLSPRVGVLFLLAFGAACSSASATGAPSASVDPANAELIGQAYQSYVRRDAKDAARQAALLPKDHLLRPWAQAWAALADPAADPGALLAFAKKFPHSLMRWRLLEESAVRLAKAGSLDKAKLALASIPERALGPQGHRAVRRTRQEWRGARVRPHRRAEQGTGHRPLAAQERCQGRRQRAAADPEFVQRAHGGKDEGAERDLQARRCATLRPRAGART